MSIDEHRIIIGRIFLKSTTKTVVEQNGEECCQTVSCHQIAEDSILLGEEEHVPGFKLPPTLMSSTV